MKSSKNYQNIKKALSASRFATYERHTKDLEHSLQLYQWNVQISAAFFECLSVCEVTLRNNVADAIQAVYGKNWAWDSTFLASLQNNPRTKLKETNKKFTTVDKIIPELPFYFWQGLFTARFDKRIWQTQLEHTLPYANHSDIAYLRESVFKDLEQIRQLRNRIAHHEPIFNRNLQGNYKRMIKITGYCSQDTAQWVKEWQRVDELLKIKPISP